MSHLKRQPSSWGGRPQLKTPVAGPRSVPVQADVANNLLEFLRKLRKSHESEQRPLEYPAYVEFLLQKIHKLIDDGSIEACIAIDVPLCVGMEIFERAESTKKLIGWLKPDNVMDLYLFSDPGKPHEILVARIGSAMRDAAISAAGMPFGNRSLVNNGASTSQLQTGNGIVLWKQADVSFEHREKNFTIPNTIPRASSCTFEVAVRNETAGICLGEVDLWVSGGGTVAIFVKVYLQEDHQGYLQPYMVAGATSAEAAGQTLHGPVSFGALSDCLQGGLPEFQLQLSTEVFTNGTSDQTPRASLMLDFFELRQQLYDNLDLDAGPGGANVRQPRRRPDPLAPEKFQAYAAAHHLIYPPVRGHQSLLWMGI